MNLTKTGMVPDQQPSPNNRKPVDLIEHSRSRQFKQNKRSILTIREN